MSLTFLGSLLSFGFQWSMARMLEPGQYATMFSLLALLAILAVPSHVVTIVATRMASAALVTHGGRHLLRGAARGIAVAGAAGLVVWIAIAAASGPIAAFLNSPERVAVVWLGGAAAVGLVAPVAKGILNGARAFVALGALGISDSGMRIAVAVVLVAMGAGTAGAIAATPIAAGLGIVLAILVTWWLFGRDREPDLDVAVERGPIDWSTNLRVAAIGLGVAGLLNVDVLVVRNAFADDQAALYAASALVGRVVLFASAPIASVLLPHLMRNASSGQPFGGVFIVGAVMATLVSGSAALIILIAPEFIFDVIFGGRYAPVPELMWGYVLAGTLFSAITLQANLHIGVSRLRIWWPILGLAVLCALTLALRHDSLAQVIWTLDAFLALTAVVQGMLTITLFRHRDDSDTRSAA